MTRPTPPTLTLTTISTTTKKLIENLPKKLNFPKTIIKNPSAMNVENPNSLFFFEKLKIFARFSENIYILRDKKCGDAFRIHRKMFVSSVFEILSLLFEMWVLLRSLAWWCGRAAPRRYTEIWHSLSTITSQYSLLYMFCCRIG